ncbi:MAG TPA: hypothetical protein ENJ97_07250 [Planctomycetes bacterium]|nr:hypothetical protein [Planctomycetota bacterium]
MDRVWRFPFFFLVFRDLKDSLEVLEEPLSGLCCLLLDEGKEPRKGETFFCQAGRIEEGPEGEDFFPVFAQEPERLGFSPAKAAFLLALGPTRARVFPKRGEADLELDPVDFRGRPPWRKRRFLTDLILCFLADRIAFSLHGSLLSREGQGLFLAAPRMAGKTTFALSLVESGWSLHSDDYCLIRSPGTTPLLSGLRRVVHLAPDTAKRFGHLVEKRLGITNLSGEKEGVLLKTGGDVYMREVPVRRILFLERDGGGETSWEPVLVRDALPLLLEQTLALDSGGRGEARFQVLAALARGAELVRVRVGREILEERGAAQGLLERLG